MVEDAMGSADINTDTSITRSGEGITETSTTVLSSPVVVSTPSESSLQSPVTTTFSSTATSSQAQLHKVSSNSSRTSIAPPKTPAPSSTTSVAKAPLPPFSRMTISAAANPTLAPVTVNAFKDSDSHTTDGTSATVRADVLIREPFSSSGQSKDKEHFRTQTPRTIKGSPPDSRKPPPMAPIPSAFAETAGGLPGLDTQQLSESENLEVVVGGDEESGMNENGMAVVQDTDRYGEGNTRRRGDIKSGTLDGSREMSNKSSITGKDSSIKGQRFTTPTPNPTTTTKPTVAKPKDANSDKTSLKAASGPSQKGKQQTAEAALTTVASASKRQPEISRISESHLPGFKLTRSLSNDTTESSSPDTTARTDPHQETLNQADGDITHGEQGIRRQQIVVRSEGHAEAVNTVLKQLRSGVLSKEFWMKDENCKECFLCGDTFSTWRRKHHCRMCGPLFATLHIRIIS
jgi:1-phosphatidylinositol-3-phosphate 5-kinase